MWWGLGEQNVKEKGGGRGKEGGEKGSNSR